MKTKSAKSSLVLKVARSSDSWEHQERAVYTVDAMEKEMERLLSPKKEQPKTEAHPRKNNRS